MDFFAREEQAQRSSRRLAWLFALAVAALVVVVNLAAAWVLGFYLDVNGAGSGLAVDWSTAHGHHRLAASTPLDAERIQALRWKVHTVVTLGTLLVIVLGSWWKTSQLGAGGATVAAMLGGRLVDPGSAEPRERVLLNVVEEMAIASGVPIPQVFVLQGEDGLNAFAAGHGPRDAVVAVTRGCLERLSREELQGVVGHEFSHLLNGDMRLNLRLMGLVHGILVIGLTGLMILRLSASGSSRSDRGGGVLPFLAIGAVLCVIGYVGFFFGGLIKAAISRQREFLADASSVQFTRNPGGLANALRKLGSRYGGARIEHTHAHETSHLFFGNAVGGQWLDLLATHPPLEQRIRSIDPAWDGIFPAYQPILPPPEEAPRAEPTTAHPRATLMAEAIAAHVGSMSPQQVEFGAALLASIPAGLADAARQPYSARAVALCLMLDPEAGMAERQLALVEGGDRALAGEMRRLRPTVAALGAAARLPLFDLCAPALRQLAGAQREALIRNARALARADGTVDLAEFCLTKLLEHQLVEVRPAGGGAVAIRPLLPHLAVLLSALARAGQADGDGDAAHAAFAAAAGKLVLTGETLDFLPQTACAPDQLERALDALGQASPGIKRRIVNACAWCVAADGIVTLREAELLRATAACLDCPMPPFAHAA